ncbi:UNVERIFIED_CONTAM: hypothetical protein HDU68_009847 [Siphonaria sp. JEL0065]|nr:hypothetical protein HDU68_009847 [Siphonaria sp. JEL0065]
MFRVDFISLEPASYGWTAIIPGFGLLSSEFPEPQLKIWDLETHLKEGYTIFRHASATQEGIRIPIKPFLGVVGVAPEQKGEFSTVPPYETGGNIDCKHVTQGSKLFLPVKVAGALVSCGDGHAAQGEGEVCGTALETPMTATVKLTLRKDMPWVKSPHYLTNPATSPSSYIPGGVFQPKGEYAALGIDPDLLEASKKALRGLLDWLMDVKGLTRVDAYLLASVVSDLKIVEAVDMPHFAVACSIPLNIFFGLEGEEWK